MPKRIADTRSMTIEDSDRTFAELAQAKLRCVKRAAMAEVRIGIVKAKLADDNQVDEGMVSVDEAVLSQFILAHPDLFAKPRQRKTDFGKYGLRTATKVSIDPDREEALIQELIDRGFDDCVVTTRKLDLKAIQKRIEEGRFFDGAKIKSGDVVTYTVDRTLVDEAREGVA